MINESLNAGLPLLITFLYRQARVLPPLEATK